jgi:hypothetical protein
MATAKEQKIKSGVVKVQRYDGSKKVGEPEYAAAGVKWVVDGIEDGTVKLVEEVPADASQIPAQGDAAVSGDRNGS